jgi:hypothetical protein
MLGHSIVSQHFMEPEGSIPISQELSTCSYPEPDQSSLHHSIPPPTYVLVFLVVSFPLAFSPIIYTCSSSPPFMLHGPPSHPPRLHYSNDTWRRVQITKFLVMQFSLFSRHLIPLWSKYLPQHPVLKHPQSMFLP